MTATRAGDLALGQDRTDRLCIDTIRTLAMDAVQQANSGHPAPRMAIAARWLGERFNRPGFPLFDYDVYALAGDGCMEALRTRFGFTPEHVVRAARDALARARRVAR